MTIIGFQSFKLLQANGTLVLVSHPGLLGLRRRLLFEMNARVQCEAFHNRSNCLCVAQKARQAVSVGSRALGAYTRLL